MQSEATLSPGQSYKIAPRKELMVCAHLRKWVESAALLWSGSADSLIQACFHFGLPTRCASGERKGCMTLHAFFHSSPCSISAFATLIFRALFQTLHSCIFFFVLPMKDRDESLKVRTNRMGRDGEKAVSSWKCVMKCEGVWWMGVRIKSAPGSRAAQAFWATASGSFPSLLLSSTCSERGRGKER